MEQLPPVPSRRRGRQRVLAFVVSVALAAAACSEGEDAEEAPVVTAPPVTPWEPLGEPGVGGRVTDVDIDPDDPDVILAAGDVAGIARTIDGGERWAASTGLASAEVGTLTRNPEDPDEVWAGTLGGPFRSIDGGVTWTAARAGMPVPSRTTFTAPVEVVLFDPAAAGRLLAFGGNQRQFPGVGPAGFGVVWESLEGGVGWRRIGAVVDGGNITSAAFLAGGRLLATVLGRGVFVSADRGATWSPASSGLPHGVALDVLAHPTVDGRAWVTLGATTGAGSAPVPGGVYRTDDGGATWVPAMQGLPATVGDAVATTSGYLEIELSPANPDVLVVSDQSRAAPAVFRSVDGGGTWTAVLTEANRIAQPYGTGAVAETVALAEFDPDTIVIGNAESVLRSDDAGVTWRDLSAEDVGDGAFRGRGWTGIVATGVAFDPATPDRLALTGRDGANLLLTATPGGATRPLTAWDQGGGATDVAVAPDGTVIAVLGQDGAFNGVAFVREGVATVEVGAGLPERGAGAAPTGVSVDPTGSGTVAVAAGGALLVRDPAGVWAADPGITGVADVGHGEDGTLWALTTAGLSRRDATGWVAVTGAPAGGVRLGVGTDRVLVTVPAGDAGGLWALDLAGGSWRRLIQDTELADAAQAPWDPAFLIAVGSHPANRDQSEAQGVLVSRDGGSVWTRSNDGLALTRVRTVAFDPHQPGRVVVGTDGQGFFERTYFVAAPPVAGNTTVAG